MRLVTRSDFDGLICAVLLEEAGIADSHLYCHPKDLQDGKIPVSKDDVLANVPYVKGCGLWFDHHTSNISYAPEDFPGAAYPAPSAARVVWDYYGGEQKFGKFVELLHYVDKVDSADLSKEEILNPTDWIMLGFITDPRTGLGRHRHFAISNYQLMQKMVYLIRHQNLEQIFTDPDVYARLAFYYQHVPDCIEAIQQSSQVNGKVVVFETRDIENMPVGNRFLIYGLYPECHTSVQIGWGRNKENVFLSVGKSILDRSSRTDIGALLRSFGGGGHENVGTCQVPIPDVDRVRDTIVEKLNQEPPAQNTV